MLGTNLETSRVSCNDEDLERDVNGRTEPDAQIDPRDAHARDRTFLSALRTVFQITILSVVMGRLFSTSATVVSALFLTFAISMLFFSAMRQRLNRQSMEHGIVRVDGISPVFFFAIGLAAVVGSIVYTIQRLIAAKA